MKNRGPARRAVLAGLGATGVAAAGGLGWHFLGPDAPTGSIAGADVARGHRLRDGNFPPPSVNEEAAVVIAGGGIAGLAAAWTLAEAGFRDFRLLELEDRVGGNSRSGRNAVSAFPLGAHYLPIPNREARGVQHLLRRLGMITGDRDGRPVYDSYQLCADLQERLFWHGRWQEGLIPPHRPYRRTIATISRPSRVRCAGFRPGTGADGKPPSPCRSPSARATRPCSALDRIGFGAWLTAQGWESPVLRNYLRYCMRDDYGCEVDDVSAWAGIHYFAGRRGWAANDAGDNVLTWPEGNDRLAQGMAAAFRTGSRPGASSTGSRSKGEGVRVDSYDDAAGRTVRTTAAPRSSPMPHFVAAGVAPEQVRGGRGIGYAPWLIANITVDRLPRGTRHAARLGQCLVDRRVARLCRRHPPGRRPDRRDRY
jgi:hypothetical protein